MQPPRVACFFILSRLPPKQNPLPEESSGRGFCCISILSNSQGTFKCSELLRFPQPDRQGRKAGISFTCDDLAHHFVSKKGGITGIGIVNT